MNRDIIAFTKYKFNVYGKKDIRSGRDSAVVGIVGKSKSLDFPTMLIFWSLVRNSVVLAVYLLFSVACFLTVHEHFFMASKKNLCSFVKRTAFTLFSRFTFSCFSSIITIEQPAMGVTKFSEGAKSWIKTN